jgi:hypothetical protein
MNAKTSIHATRMDVMSVREIPQAFRNSSSTAHQAAARLPRW